MVCVVTESVSVCVHQCYCVWNTLFPWSLPSPPAPDSLSPPLPHRSGSLGGRDLMKTECSKVSHAALCPVWVFVLNPHILQESFLMWVELIGGYNNMLLGVILLLCYISRIIVLGFPPGP